MPKRAFKKPNTKLLKAIAFIKKEKQSELSGYSLKGDWWSFKVGLAFSINKTFWEKTKVFNKNLVHLTENEVTFYIKQLLIIASFGFLFTSCKKTEIVSDKLPSGTMIQAEVISNYKYANLKVENLTTGKIIFDVKTTELVDTLKKEALTGCLFRTNNKDRYKISYSVSDTASVGYLKEPIFSKMKIFIVGYEKYNQPGKVLNNSNLSDEYFIN